MIKYIYCTAKYFLFCLLIIFAIALNGLRIFLLDIEKYKPNLESRILTLTDVPIKIGNLRATMHGFNPKISLHDVQILVTNANNKSIIGLEKIHFKIDLLKLLFSQQVLNSSKLTLTGAKFTLARQKSGKISIVGLRTTDSTPPYWLLQLAEIAILNTDITWLDKQSNHPSIRIKKVNFLLKNKSYSGAYELYLSGKLPKKYGTTLRVFMATQDTVFDIKNINLKFYVEGDKLVLKEWLQNKLPLDLKTLTGTGDVKLLGSYKKAKLDSLFGNIKAKNIVLSQEKKTYQIEHINTDLMAKNNASGWTIKLLDLELKSKKYTNLITGFNALIDYNSGYFAGFFNTLELSELTELIQFYPALNNPYKIISSLDLTGQLKNFAFYGNTKNHQYAVNGDFKNIAISAVSASPQVKNINGSIKGTEHRGLISLNTKNAQVFFPELFKQPFWLSNLNVALDWKKKTNVWQIFSKSFFIDTADFQTQSKITLTIPKNTKDIFIDSQISFANIQNISKLSKYYPVGIMDANTIAWLNTALVAGKIKQGKASIHGKLKDFPFAHGQGLYKLSFSTENSILRYSQDWPQLTNMYADIFWLNDNLKVNITHAKTDGVVVKEASIELPSTENNDYVLVKTQLEASVLAGLKFLQQTPLHKNITNVLDTITPTGLTQVKLALKIPWSDETNVDIDGVAKFQEVDLITKSTALSILGLSGDLSFNKKSWFSDNISAKFLGYPISIKINTEDLDVNFKVHGQADILQLNKQFNLLPSSLLKENQASSLTPYKLKFSLAEKYNQAVVLEVESNLQGLAIELPATLKKSAKQTKPLLIKLLLNNKKVTSATINYNHELKLTYNGLGINKLSPKIKLQLKQDVFDLSKWMDVIDTNFNNQKKSAFKINAVSFVANQLHWNANNFGKLQMAAKLVGNNWQGNVTNKLAKGEFSVPVHRTGQDKIKLDMDYLNIDELMQIKSQNNNLTSKNFVPIALSSKQLWLNGIDFGKLKVESERLSTGIRLYKINLTSADHDIDLIAERSEQKDTSMTYLDGAFKTNDFGQFLSQLNINNDFKETQAKIYYIGNWSGNPMQFLLKNLKAEINLELKNGRISNIEPGIGRILGLIAIEQWMKRLNLDFSDLYKQGLSFNKIKGDLYINNGQTAIEYLLVDAIPAQITITGEADLLKETLNLRAKVIPKTSSAIPIAGTIFGTIAKTITKYFVEDYSDGYFFGSEYLLTGYWDDIKVATLRNKDGVIKKVWLKLTDFSWLHPVAE